MKIIRNESLKKHTSFRIGGCADWFAVVSKVEELSSALAFAREKRLPVSVMGAGTNLLPLDKGFRGLVIKLGQTGCRPVVRGKMVTVWAGCPLGKLIAFLRGKKLGGLEFLAGIPGSVGGAVVMNAGAWGKEIGRQVVRVKTIDAKGEIRSWSKKELAFSYRSSMLQRRPLVVFEVTLRLRTVQPALAREKIAAYLHRRKELQPLGSPNAGSVFRNPPGHSAGRLLEECGCKGCRFGDAQVSSKHANFIVNLGEARASDVLKLVTRLQNVVWEKKKVRLEPEIKIMVKSI